MWDLGTLRCPATPYTINCLEFCGSGVYLWLTAPSRSVWAWASVAAGTASLGALWKAFR